MGVSFGASKGGQIQHIITDSESGRVVTRESISPSRYQQLLRDTAELRQGIREERRPVKTSPARGSATQNQKQSSSGYDSDRTEKAYDSDETVKG